MRTTITLDDDIFEAARAQAQASGKRLGAVVSELARRGLRQPGRYKIKHGLPVFVVGKDAPIIPSSRAKELLNQELA